MTDHSPAEEEFTTWLKGVIAGDGALQEKPGQVLTAPLHIQTGHDLEKRIVFVNFSAMVRSMVLTPFQAQQLGRVLLYNADKIR